MLEMPYSDYVNLSAKDKKIYQASDKVANLKLKNTVELIPKINDVKTALLSENKANVQQSSQALATNLTKQLEVPTVKIKVLACRPYNYYGEMHGMYEPVTEKKKFAEISVWMRTAKRKQVVAFKTYLRTLFHELCHHFDYELLELEDSFHTEGFFKRESSLIKQLVL